MSICNLDIPVTYSSTIIVTHQLPLPLPYVAPNQSRQIIHLLVILFFQCDVVSYFGLEVGGCTTFITASPAIVLNLGASVLTWRKNIYYQPFLDIQ